MGSAEYEDLYELVEHDPIRDAVAVAVASEWVFIDYERNQYFKLAPNGFNDG